MIEAGGEAAEGVVRVRRRDKLLKLRQVVKLQMIVEERRLQADTFTELGKRRLGG